MTSINQRRMHRQVNGPLADRLQKHWLRRMFVLGAIAGAAITGAGFVVYDDRLWVLLLCAIPFGVFTVLMNLSLRGIFELSEEQLDEYQVGLRNHAYKRAYGFMLVFIVVVATTLAALQPGRLPTFAVATFAFLISALLPRLIVAWQLEDADGDE
ncbi:MAG: hypothetical protein R3358_05470 [Woeseiaceae bacterium]|nr:hypothetical protein [Woeseiaceae bacterium]